MGTIKARKTKLVACCLSLIVASAIGLSPTPAQTIRQLILERQQRVDQGQEHGDGEATSAAVQNSANQNVPVVDPGTDIATEKCKMAGLDVALWIPHGASKPLPLVVFSHGFGGIDTQSKFLMKAIAAAGYLVVSPNHRDSSAFGLRFQRPEVSFLKATQWSDSTYKDRDNDIVHLIDALRQDPKWNSQIDWSRVAVSGHSLGGYTALGLSGAWPSWRMAGVKACLAISPYCEPFTQKDTLKGIGIPVMYLGGTRDRGITPTVIREDGAFSKTSSPAIFVEFQNVGHFDFTDFNRNKNEQELIDYYCVAFLNKYVKDDAAAKPTANFSGVSQLLSK